jgi:hypothetical protein
MKKQVRFINSISARLPAHSVPLIPRRDTERRGPLIVIGDGKEVFTLTELPQLIAEGKLRIEQYYIEVMQQIEAQQALAAMQGQMQGGGIVDNGVAVSGDVAADSQPTPADPDSLLSIKDLEDEEESEEDDIRFAPDQRLDATGPSIVQATQEQLNEDRFCAAIEELIQPLMAVFGESAQDLQGKDAFLVEQLAPLQAKGIIANLQLNANHLKAMYEQALPELFEHACSKFKDLTGNEDNVMIARIYGIDKDPRAAELLQTLTLYRRYLEQVLQDIHRRQRFIIEYLAVDTFRKMIKGGARSRYRKGDQFLCLSENSDPATIPSLGSSLGCPGAHIIFGPRNLEDMQMNKTPIFGHEIGHDAYAGFENYEPDSQKFVLAGLQTAFLSGDLKFSSATINIFGHARNTLEAMMQLFGQDVLNELNADIIAIRRFGKAFVLSMIEYFAALYNDQQNVTVFTNGNRSIPNSTVFLIDKQTGALLYEAHLPPAVRIILNCYVLAMMGFAEDAQYCLEVFKQITKRKRLPKWALWFSEDGSNFFKQCNKDILAAGKVAVYILQHTKFACFSGNTLAQVLPFTKEDQNLIDQLVEIIVDENRPLLLPQVECGANHIGAAAQLANWAMVASGQPTEAVTGFVEDRSFALLKQLRDRENQEKQHDSKGDEKLPS